MSQSVKSLMKLRFEYFPVVKLVVLIIAPDCTLQAFVYIKDKRLNLLERRSRFSGFALCDPPHVFVLV